MLGLSTFVYCLVLSRVGIRQGSTRVGSSAASDVYEGQEIVLAPGNGEAGGVGSACLPAPAPVAPPPVYDAADSRSIARASGEAVVDLSLIPIRPFRRTYACDFWLRSDLLKKKIKRTRHLSLTY